MNIKISTNLNLSLLSSVERKLVKKRIKELETCSVLGEIKYGRPHPLRGNKTGMYGLRIGKYSRLLLLPFEYDMAETNDKKEWHHCITGVTIYYSPNHYKTYY